MYERGGATYLNDRYAIVTAGAELAARAARSNEGTEYAPLFERAIKDLVADQALLLELMEGSGAAQDKLASGRLTAHSPQSRVVEIDVLTAVLTTLDGTWAWLLSRAPDHFEALEAARRRARRNLERLADLRPQAVADDRLAVPSR